MQEVGENDGIGEVGAGEGDDSEFEFGGGGKNSSNKDY